MPAEAMLSGEKPKTNKKDLCVEYVPLYLLLLFPSDITAIKNRLSLSKREKKEMVYSKFKRKSTELV